MSGFSPEAWKTRKLIEAAGDRVGIYFNKLKSPEITSSHRIDALLFEYPPAILVWGPCCTSRAGSLRFPRALP